MSTFAAADFHQFDELLTSDGGALRDRNLAWMQGRFLPVVTGHYRAGTFPMGLVPDSHTQS